MNDRRATRAIVSGRVQGVGFRWSVLRRARALGVVGHVRNLRDGTVEVVVGGADDLVRELLDYVATGPPGAVVSAVETAPMEGVDLPAGFEIR